MWNLMKIYMNRRLIFSIYFDTEEEAVLGIPFFVKRFVGSGPFPRVVRNYQPPVIVTL
jgi:hypothetical protein